jgi:hemerythrin superfamily protein
MKARHQQWHDRHRQRESSLGRNLAVVAGSVAIGVLGSRLLPPMLAMANGSVRARLGEGPFDRLKQDHRQILAILDQMVEREDDSTMSQGALFLSLKRTLAKHALAEEDVVYPVLHERAHAVEEAKKLYSEHADMKVHLYGLEDALKQGLGWDTRVQALRSLIRRHVEDEESVQFPRLEALMDEQLSRATPAQIRREKAMIL